MNKQFKIMEMTAEQKQRKYEKETEWRIANPEKVKEYSKRSYEKNREYYRNYYKNYRVLHKEHLAETQKKWREFNDKRDTVYMFINDLGDNIYVGSTTYKNTRLANHLTGNSNLKLTAEELVNTYNLSCILYQDFTNYNLNRFDLYWIEKFYKDTQGEIFKGNSVTCDLSKLSRSEDELFEIMNNVEFKIFDKLDKYLN
ncbi:GIY-YIG nuclease family protein [Clostridium beijerinckii]|uniref:GIY-YIG domain-containing protein n=1 Tax=Clostridium beijerinckii TaxID=1520 RepID=A0AAX0B849_CLOBE|nr:GIY-YIG nuclease family protein [Clostridium beijerinckii]NRT91495.1 hypothetical protein [Clostridium beijerinckii]NYC71020.1 hypothetical protein [Clostridium beijerinckii]